MDEQILGPFWLVSLGELTGPRTVRESVSKTNDGDYKQLQRVKGNGGITLAYTHACAQTHTRTHTHAHTQRHTRINTPHRETEEQRETETGRQTDRDRRQRETKT